MKKNNFFVGNWKANPSSLLEAKRIIKAEKKIVASKKSVKIVFCPPAAFLSSLAEGRFGTNVSFGVQDIFYEPSGSFTGALTAPMLRSVGADYVILGHSEMRARGDSDETINKKVQTAFKFGFNVVLCVGENERDSNGDFLSYLRNQIRNDLARVNKKYLSKLVVAYEPVWAIGKDQSEAVSPRDLHEMSIFVRKVLAEIYGISSVTDVPILYGGSVGPGNAKELFIEGKVQGFLVGRQSLDPVGFKEIINILS